jgi:hypothetical protein
MTSFAFRHVGFSPSWACCCRLLESDRQRWSSGRELRFFRLTRTASASGEDAILQNILLLPVLTADEYLSERQVILIIQNLFDCNPKTTSLALNFS